MIGVGVVAFFLVINASIRASIDEALDQGFAGDFVVSSGDFGMTGLPTTVAQQMGELPDVETATPMRFAPAEVDGDDGAMAASTGDIFYAVRPRPHRGQRRPRRPATWSSRRTRPTTASPSARR